MTNGNAQAEGDTPEKPNPQLKPEIRAGGNVTFFNTKIEVYYKHSGQGIYSDEFVIYHHDQISSPITLSDMAVGIYNSLYSIVEGGTPPAGPDGKTTPTLSDDDQKKDASQFATDIQEKLPKFVNDVIKSISVRFNEVFFHVKRVREDGKLHIDYAFWISLSYDNNTLKLPIAIEDLYLKVWNTENSRILEEMAITTMKDLLNPPPKSLTTDSQKTGSDPSN